PSDIDDVGTVRDHRFAARQRGVDSGTSPNRTAIEKRIGREVQDAHHERAIASEMAGADMPRARADGDKGTAPDGSVHAKSGVRNECICRTGMLLGGKGARPDPVDGKAALRFHPAGDGVSPSGSSAAWIVTGAGPSRTWRLRR